MSDSNRFTIHLEHLEDYSFKVKFDWDDVDDLLLDEPQPLGHEQGPNASRLLAAAAANCLSASLLFCAHKSDVPAAGLHTEVSGTIVRNDKGRLRVGGLEVRITINEEIQASRRLTRCLDLFEDFCVVTASLRQGIPVTVQILDVNGKLLHQGD